VINRAAKNSKIKVHVPFPMSSTGIKPQIFCSYGDDFTSRQEVKSSLQMHNVCGLMPSDDIGKEWKNNL
jgi:hypothetical protein